MAEKTEKQIRHEITQLFVRYYIPELTKVIAEFQNESFGTLQLGDEISKIVGRPVGMPLGMIKVSEPTNRVIDILVDMYVQKNK